MIVKLILLKIINAQITFDNYLDLKNKEINSQEFKETILRKIKIAYKNAIQYAVVMKKLILTDLHQSIINIRANEDGLNRLNEFFEPKKCLELFKQ